MTQIFLFLCKSQSWLNKRPAGEASILHNLFHKCFDDIYVYVSHNLLPKMETLECNYIKQVSYFADCFSPFTSRAHPAKISMEYISLKKYIVLPWSVCIKLKFIYFSVCGGFDSSGSPCLQFGILR